MEPSLRWIAFTVLLVVLDVRWAGGSMCGRDGVREYVVPGEYVTAALVRQWMTRSGQTAPNPSPPSGSFLGHGPPISATTVRTVAIFCFLRLRSDSCYERPEQPCP